jgi:urea-proton symporter
VGWIAAVILSFIFPAKYSSTDARHIERSNKIQGISPTPTAPESPTEPRSGSMTPRKTDEKAGSDAEEQPTSNPQPESIVKTGNEIIDFLEASTIEPMDPVAVKKSSRLAIGANLIFFFVAIVLVPFTLFGTRYIYGRSFFTGWIIVSFIWVWTSMMICVVYPVVESTGALKAISKGLWQDVIALFGRRKPHRASTADGDA